MDLTVPGGMGGIEAMHRIREIDPHVTAIVTSGYTNDSVFAEFEAHGFSAAIRKPFVVDEFLDVVSKTLEESGK